MLQHSLALPLFIGDAPAPFTNHTTLLISVIALIVSLVSAVAAVGRWSASHRQIRIQALLQITNFLHQTEYRDARHALAGKPIEEVDFQTVRKVCSSFDFAALFVRNDLIDKALFIRYWKPVLRYLGDHLTALSEVPVLDGATMRDYYEHLFWLLGELKNGPKP